MPENFEYLKPQIEPTSGIKNNPELIELKPKEKVFLDTIITSICRDRYESGVGKGYLDPSIVRSIAEINLKAALRIVQQEEKPRIEVLAQLAILAKDRPDSGVDFENLFASIETFANKTHGNYYTNTRSIAKVAIVLREARPDISERLFQLAVDNATADKSSDGWGRKNGFIAKCRIVEYYARVNPQKAEELLREFNVTEDPVDTKPIGTTIQKYLKLGDVESAYRVAIERGNADHVARAGAEIAKTNSPRLVETITDKWVTKKEEYYVPKRENAVVAYAQIVDRLMRSGGNKETAQLLIDEAKKVLVLMSPVDIPENPYFNARLQSTDELIPAIAHINPDEALNLLNRIWNDQNDKLAFSRIHGINKIAAATSFHDIDKALEIFSLTGKDSYGRTRALVTITQECIRQGKLENVPKLLDQIREFHVGVKSEEITFGDIASLSKHYPDFGIEMLGKVDSISPYLDFYDLRKIAEDTLMILRRNNLPISEQSAWLNFLGTKKIFDSEILISISDSIFFEKLEQQNSELLNEEGILSYFQSLNPKNESDITALKNLVSTGLIPEHKIEDLFKKDDAQSLTLLSLLLCAEIYKKTDFDLASLDRLMLLAQSENQSVCQVALRAIKLLQPKVAELFYSSNQQYQDVLKKLYGLSSETQRWFSDLDEHIAENFDTKNLIRLVTKLGQEEALQMFPQAMAKAREEILAHLPSNKDLADYFLENLQLYKAQPWAVQGIKDAIKHFPVAQKFIKAFDGGVAPWKDSTWAASVYTKAKLTKPHDEEEWDEERGVETQGFTETDPYENHRWKFTGEQIKIASALSDIISRKVNEQSIKELGLSVESQKILKTVEQSLKIAYENFISEIQASTTFPEEDKNALLHPENSSVRMTNLRDNIRSFVARYLTQMAEGDIVKLNKELANISENLEGILQEGFRRFIKIHEVDVPLYDKLYEEFDNLRETGQYPLEVYLGRDGIYAWLGRRAQDVARRRKLGLEGRKQAKEAGEVIEIQPKYLTYPRYFRDNINYEAKREFLEQEGISPNVDPMFYDTGYTGTIPEQIMRIMDFENEEIERRIRLLSAPVIHRRVKGIPENARAEIIEYIEHNAKTEDTAVGLIKDSETGKIRHIAKPTAPDEQFYFMMVKQAISRHYWLREQLHHESSGNINLDSEHYLIRIRQEYSALLPPELVSDPKQYLAQQGELLKGSKGEGKYPDEEVVLFKLLDDTEIVAKRVELRKAKEGRKEFSILIAARKANLPTAEPVGFLSGKTEADSSYLLMKKIEGFSGRKFEKHLRDSGKYNDEQVKSIMQTVAEKNKEMAELFRETLNIDKRWRIKDTIIEFDEETGEVVGVTPIDWERIQNYDPENPKEIDEIT